VPLLSGLLSSAARALLLFYLAACSAFLVFFLKAVSHSAGEQVVLSREELSAYECGFEHHNISRLPISLRYFLMTLLFLLFDLEIVFLLLLPPVALSSLYSRATLLRGCFVLFLIVTLLYE
jgi:NADH:ubiquinone oxidoreductase subunit 3 (subunit A)